MQKGGNCFEKVTIVLSVILVVSIMFATCGFAINAAEESRPRMTYIDSCSGDINQGVLSTTVTASITGKSSVTSVKIKMELQKLSSGNYSTVETWEQTFFGSYGSMEKSKLTNPLSTYRLKATFTAYIGSNSEAKTLYVNED